MTADHPRTRPRWPPPPSSTATHRPSRPLPPGMRRGHTDREHAVALYLAVRDGFRYDPYRIDLSPQGMTASTVLANGYGWCVPKAALLTAACRAADIPARMGVCGCEKPPQHRAHARDHAKPTSSSGTATPTLCSMARGARPRPPSTSSCASALACCRWSSTAKTIRSTTRSTRPASGTWNTCTSAARSMTCRSRRSWRTSARCTAAGCRATPPAATCRKPVLPTTSKRKSADARHRPIDHRRSSPLGFAPLTAGGPYISTTARCMCCTRATW